MRNWTAILLICTLLLNACATAPAKHAAPPANVKEWVNRARANAWRGFLAGAIIGVATVVITGGSGEDMARRALELGVVGAIAGFAIGKAQDRVYAARDNAVRESGYTSAQGYVGHVQVVQLHPRHPKPGTAATLYVRYIVIGPDPKERIKVKLFRGLKYGDNYVFGAGPNEFVVPNGGGVVESRVSLTFPEKAPVGTYGIEALLEDSRNRFPQAMGTGELYIVARGAERGARFAPAP